MPAPGNSSPLPPGVEPSLTRSDRILTLNGSLGYAMQNRREYMTAKEDLYIAALSLTLERHLWTPQLAADYRVVYGNYGENKDFAQAMRSFGRRHPLAGYGLSFERWLLDPTMGPYNSYGNGGAMRASPAGPRSFSMNSRTSSRTRR